jgi:hypothetical protein
MKSFKYYFEQVQLLKEEGEEEIEDTEPSPEDAVDVPGEDDPEELAVSELKGKEFDKYISFKNFKDTIRHLEKEFPMLNFDSIRNDEEEDESDNLELGSNTVTFTSDDKEKFEIVIVKTPNGRYGLKSGKVIGEPEEPEEKSEE